jgi:hypothetical protein
MCSRSGSDHAGKIAGRNRVGGCTAQTFALVFAFDPALGKRQATGAHRTVLATRSLNPDVTGFHGNRPIKDGVNSQFLGAPDHLLTGGIHRGCDGISDFFSLLCFDFLFIIGYFCHTNFLLSVSTHRQW